MKKTLQIEGMSCGHCQARVEKALNDIAGVKAVVDLKKAQAVVRLSEPVDDALLIQAVADAGYRVTAIAEKKGLFS